MVQFRLILAALAWCAFASIARAEQLAWRVPEELHEMAVPSADAARYAARDVRVSRFEYSDGRVTRRIILTDMPSAGRVATDNIATLASDVVGRTGASSCVQHTVSPAREFSINGRAAAEVLLMCRGTIVPPNTNPNEINIRRTVFIRGETRFYMFQADEYARDTAAFDQAASAARWDDPIGSLIWCADSNVPCVAAPAN